MWGTARYVRAAACADLKGMHELLAVCLMVVDRDSLVASKTPAPSPMVSSPFSPLQRSSVLPSGISEAMVVTLDRAYIEHDAFDLFQELMRPAKSFYEWRTEEGAVSGAEATKIMANKQGCPATGSTTGADHRAMQPHPGPATPQDRSTAVGADGAGGCGGANLGNVSLRQV